MGKQDKKYPEKLRKSGEKYANNTEAVQAYFGESNKSIDRIPMPCYYDIGTADSRTDKERSFRDEGL